MKRWNFRRKLEVVHKIKSGRITFADACRMHEMTATELDSWIAQASGPMRTGLSAVAKMDVGGKS